MSLRIRKAEPRDIPAVLAIEREQFSNPWPEKHFSAELAFPFAHFFVAADDQRGEICAFIVFWRLGRTVELHNIAVCGRDQRRGIAAQLLSFMLASVGAQADEVFLEVRASNAGAIRLYEKFDFCQTSRRPGYYQNPEEDALVMRRLIKKSLASP